MRKLTNKNRKINRRKETDKQQKKTKQRKKESTPTDKRKKNRQKEKTKINQILTFL